MPVGYSGFKRHRKHQRPDNESQDFPWKDRCAAGQRPALSVLQALRRALDAHCQRVGVHSIDFMKVDVEGAMKLRCSKGAAGMLSHVPRYDQHLEKSQYQNWVIINKPVA